jgi:hypothetical protein
VRHVFSLAGGLSLALTEPGATDDCGAPGYPTAGLQKGLLLLDEGRELAGEGVGFGVPVLKRGMRAVFAGGAKIDESRDVDGSNAITLAFRMDRVERLGSSRRASPLLVPLDLLREMFALLYRRAAFLRRGLLAGSNGVRWVLRVRTRFEPVPLVACVPVTFTLHADGRVAVRADLSALPSSVTEVVMMNELDGRVFDRYVEGGGASSEGRRIGAWDLVGSATAAFVSDAHHVGFAVDRDPDPAAPARLFRGREIAHGRLGWAGFGYVLRPGPAGFSYEVRIGPPSAPDAVDAAASAERASV